MLWYSLLFKNFPQLVVIHTVKGCSVVGEYPCSQTRRVEAPLGLCCAVPGQRLGQASCFTKGTGRVNALIETRGQFWGLLSSKDWRSNTSVHLRQVVPGITWEDQAGASERG